MLSLVLVGIGTALPWYGGAGSGRSWSLYEVTYGGSKTTFAVLITIFLLPGILSCFLSWFRTPNDQPNLSPVLTGFVMLATFAMIVLVGLCVAPVDYLHVMWGEVFCLVFAVLAAISAITIWRLATTHAVAVPS